MKKINFKRPKILSFIAISIITSTIALGVGLGINYGYVSEREKIKEDKEMYIGSEYQILSTINQTHVHYDHDPSVFASSTSHYHPLPCANRTSQSTMDYSEMCVDLVENNYPLSALYHRLHTFNVETNIAGKNSGIVDAIGMWIKAPDHELGKDGTKIIKQPFFDIILKDGGQAKVWQEKYRNKDHFELTKSWSQSILPPWTRVDYKNVIEAKFKLNGFFEWLEQPEQKNLRDHWSEVNNMTIIEIDDWSKINNDKFDSWWETSLNILINELKIKTSTGLEFTWRIKKEDEYCDTDITHWEEPHVMGCS